MDEAKASSKAARILVADDSPTVANVLQATLEHEGYEVILAMDGLEAISKTYQEHPDLIVLDIFMPKINGYQVCRMLKSDEVTSHIPIIMLTGSERGDRFWSVETGADEFQTKDFEFQRLTESIQRLLSDIDIARRSKTDASESANASKPGDEVQVLSKLSHLLDRELYRSTIEKMRLGTILDSLGEGVFTIDADKRVVAFNRSLQQMTGLSLEQVSGKRCADVIRSPLCNSSCLFHKAMKNVKDEDQSMQDKDSSAAFLIPIAAETEIEGQGGQKIPVNPHLTLLRDHVGKIIGAVCVLRDITRMKEIERMNDELSKAYKDLQNAQTQLIQSEKMASLGRLVAGAAHELNNPISFIYSNISHLRRYIQDIETILSEYSDVGCWILDTRYSMAESSTQNPASSMQHPVSSIQSVADRISDIEDLKKEIDLDYTIKDLDRLVDDMDEGAKITKEIVEDLRAFSRSDEGRIEDTDINQDMERTLSMLVDHYKSRITIHRDYADLPRVECYADQISRVLMNLMTNACQAIDGEGDIWVKTRLEDNAVVVSVRDNGVGISEEYIGKIFDPFFTTRDVGEGTGLGLSISYGIIQRHKGEILVDSQVGLGTTFTVRIPIVLAHGR